jgi:thiol-disulfide isomerase/thioredoxin
VIPQIPFLLALEVLKNILVKLLINQQDIMNLKKHVSRKPHTSDVLTIGKIYLVIALILSALPIFAQKKKTVALATFKEITVPTGLLLNKSIKVSGTITNPAKDLKTIKFLVNNAVTSIQEVNIADVDESGHFSLSIPALHVVPDIMIRYGDLVDSFISFPGDSIGIKINYSSFVKSSRQTAEIIFTGTRKELVNEYHKYNENAQRAKIAYYDKLKENIHQLNDAAYKLYRTHLLKLDDSLFYDFKKKHGASRQLEEIVLLQNQYSWANDLLEYGLYHDVPKFTKLSKEYLSFVTPGLLNNPRGLLAKNYTSFLKSYELVTSLADGSVETPVMKAIAFAINNDPQMSSEGKKSLQTYLDNGGNAKSQAEMDTIMKFMQNDYIERFSSAYFIDYNVRRIDNMIPIGLGKNLVLAKYLYGELNQNNLVEDSILNRFSDIVKSRIIQQPIFDKNAELDKRVNKVATSTEFKGQKLSSPGETLLADLTNKYKGKVIYIDFWATWCSPCLMQIDQVKPIKSQFKDVVFLYLCASSPEGRWKFLVQDKGIAGEHYLLSSDQLNYLSKSFNISSFPHYLLINKRGELANPNSPSPSKGKELTNALTALSKE